ncbi:dehydration-responsive element-binding protein 1A-like [Spinacia oleracea]|uniref:Dehydration-responsive element-binding protein 1A-like n=1 Tax=Spinacia oleracea TaxID=3562 RepID=A0A9R0JRH8_SPIOL|nr:dehydration-responsive element-binding protein 1A-like [Spinacia oleracea]
MDSGNGSNNYDDQMALASSCPKKRAGRKKLQETRHPVYRGVRMRNGDRWVCEVRAHNNSRIWLGTYPTAEMAARAHDVAALALRGSTACLNFADSAWRLRVPASTNTRDIQQAAAEAAEAFRGGGSEVYVGENSNMSNNNVNNVTMQASGGGNEVRTNTNNNEVLHQQNAEYVDEEAVYNMPGLLQNMAEGMLLPPPQNPYEGYNWNDETDDCDVSLWNY